MSHSSTSHAPRKGIAPYLYIAAGLLVVFVALALGPKIRVGDGGEYYGLFYAWDVTHRPWMSAPAYQAYDALFKSNAIEGMVSVDMLANMFPSLRIGGTSDFNHFWFYSFLAFLCAKLVGVIGVHLSAHQSFLALHFLLANLTFGVAYRYHGWRGALAVGLMLFASPAVWFTNKVHTEWMTMCVVLAAVATLTARRYVASALLIALAATQNPSFALVCCIPLFYRVVLERARPYTLGEMIMMVATVIAVLMHPVYYFSRYGVPTPQLLAGGAVLGRDLGKAYVWIFDPDLGLLPNWPLGLLVLLTAAGMFALNRSRSAVKFDRLWWGFLLVYLAINLYAHSSTTNLNAGGTPGLARYALWYLPLGFPVFLWVIGRIEFRTKTSYAATATAAFLLVTSVVVNSPRKAECYWKPSITSKFLQAELPNVYDPPDEVFLERYSGVGEGVHALKLLAVFGPDCRKAIITPLAEHQGALAPSNCLFDPARLNSYINATFGVQAHGIAAAHYIHLSNAQAESLHRTVAPGPHVVHNDTDGTFILGSGWSSPEAWGVWSDGKKSELVFPCDARQYYGPDKPFSLSLALRPFLEQRVAVTGKSGTLWEGPITTVDQVVRVNVPAADCEAGQYRIRLEIPGAISPADKGMSADARRLGIGLSSFEIRPAAGT